jgi:predicted murein hydrolase (TIGR00659 family)
MSAVLSRSNELIASPVFALALTVGAYAIGCGFQTRCRSSPMVNPVLVAILLVAGFLIVTGTPYQQYFEGARPIHLLLGPATVALAIPLYANFEHVRRSALPIIVAVLVGATVGTTSAIAISRALGASDLVVKSLAEKGVTTPIAMALSQQFGGLPDLTAILVIATGIIGATFATSLLDLLGIKCWRARGLATGVAAHGIGTARIVATSELGGAFATLGLGLCAVATAALMPIIDWLFWR